jgi:hypothetical protein
MSKLSDNTLLQRAIRPACLDRMTFAEACSNDVDEVAIIHAEIVGIASLKGKRLSALSPAQDELARLAFLYAESYEISLADSCPGTDEAKRSLAKARQFRDTRRKRWGKTHLETYMENSKSVSVFDIISGKAGI